jgi:hypothetical protein
MSSSNYQPPSIDELLAKNWLSPRQRPMFEAVAQCTTDGSRIGAIPFDVRSKSRHETRAAQKHSELLLAAHALVSVNVRGLDLSPGESPDFTLSLGADRVGLEVAELIEPTSARTQNAAENIRIVIRERLDGDAALRSRLGDRFISVQTWDTPKRSHERGIADECFRLLASGVAPNLRAHQFEDKAYPLLSYYRGHLYESKLTGGMFDYKTPPCSYDPQAMISIASRVLYRKKKKALTYGGGRLWLVMSITDMMGSFDQSVEVMGSFLPDIAPFEFVIVRGLRSVALWSATQNSYAAI